MDDFDYFGKTSRAQDAFCTEDDMQDVLDEIEADDALIEQMEEEDEDEEDDETFEANAKARLRRCLDYRDWSDV